jgi:PST family polysaccharide transporter
MDEPLESRDIKVRAVRGVASLLARQLLVRALGFVGMLVLARVLTPAIFGVFAIAQFVVLFFDQISSLGLSAALLRKKEPVTERELSTVFTVQQLVVAGSIVLILSAAPLIVQHYQLQASHVALIRAMAAALLFASLKTIPTVLLERRLRHDLVAISEVTEYFAYQLAAVGLALLGLGVWALAIALLVRGLVGVVVLYAVSWWRPRFAIEWQVLKEIVRFGVPIQLANLVGLAGNAVAPVLVGSALGAAAVGFVNFSRSVCDALVFQPLIIMSRVQFRVFGHLQDERRVLAQAIERSIYLGAVLTFSLTAIAVSIAHPMVAWIGSGKWGPALVLLYVFAAAYLLYAVVQPLMQALKALGDSGTQLQGLLLQVICQIGLFLALAGRLGAAAYAAGTAAGLVLATALACVRLRRHVDVRITRNLRVPLLSAVPAAALGVGTSALVKGAIAIPVAAATCALVFFVMMGLAGGERIARELALVTRAMFPQSSIVCTIAHGLQGVLMKLHRMRYGWQT